MLFHANSWCVPFGRRQAHTAPHHPKTSSYWCARHCLCSEAPRLGHPLPHSARPLPDRASPRPLTAMSPDTKEASPTRSKISSAVLRSTRALTKELLQRLSIYDMTLHDMIRYDILQNTIKQVLTQITISEALQGDRIPQ